MMDVVEKEVFDKNDVLPARHHSADNQAADPADNDNN